MIRTLWGLLALALVILAFASNSPVVAAIGFWFGLVIWAALYMTGGSPNLCPRCLYDVPAGVRKCRSCGYWFDEGVSDGVTVPYEDRR